MDTNRLEVIVMFKHPKLNMYLKPSTGISRGHGRRKSGGKALAQAQKELAQTKTELKQTQDELARLQADYEDLLERINSINEQVFSSGSSSKVNPKYAEPTVSNMHAAFTDLHKYREFVRICDLRNELGWSREKFDNMLANLRDNSTVQLFRADESMLTREEIRDSFTDDRGFIMGLITWGR